MVDPVPGQQSERDWMLRFAELVKLLLAVGDMPSPQVVRTFIREHARSEMEAFETWKESQ